jgi:uncharacterized protein
MIIGVLTLRFALHDNHSLKGKRQFAASLKQKLRNHFNAAVAEVDDQDLLDRLTLAVVVVSGDGVRVQSQLSKVLAMVEAVSVEDLVDAHQEIFAADGGKWSPADGAPDSEELFGEPHA